MAPNKPKTYNMLLVRVFIANQPQLIVRQSTLRLKNGDGRATSKAGGRMTPSDSQSSDHTMEIYIDNKLLGRWNLTLLREQSVQNGTQEFQSDKEKKILHFTLPSPGQALTASSSRGPRKPYPFFDTVQLHVASHQDFHTAISFLSKDAGLVHREIDGSLVPFTRPRSQASVVPATQSPRTFQHLTLSRPQTATMLRPRPPSQISSPATSFEMSGSQSRIREMPINQEYGSLVSKGVSAPHVSSTMHRALGSFTNTNQSYQQPRYAPPSRNRYRDLNVPESHFQQSGTPLRWPSRNAGALTLDRRSQLYDETPYEVFDDDSQTSSLLSSQQGPRQSTLDMFDDGQYDAPINAFYRDDFHIETDNPHEMIAITAGRKRPASRQARPQPTLKKRPPLYDVPDIQGPYSSQGTERSGITTRQTSRNQAQLGIQSLPSSQAVRINLISDKGANGIERAPFECVGCRRKNRQCDRMLPTCGPCANDGRICVSSFDNSRELNASKTGSQNTKCVEVSNKGCQTLASIAATQESGMQTGGTSSSRALHTTDQHSGDNDTETVNIVPSTFCGTSDRAVQTEDPEVLKLELCQWANLVASARELGERQLQKGIQALQGSEPTCPDYEEKLLVAARCGGELMDGLIELYVQVSREETV